MKVGFTGSRVGMTRAQMDAFYKFVCELPTLTEFHHGACVGADAEATDTVAEIPAEGGERIRIIAHPCDMVWFTQREAVKQSDTVLPVKPPLDRNKDIVNVCDLLVACPEGPERQRSGTWSTVRYARKKGKRIVIVWPDGKLTEEAA